jgi:beta-xylosidase
VPKADKAVNLWFVPNFLLQKFPALEFTVTTKLDFANLAMGERAGLVVMGMDYSNIAVERAADGFRLVKAACKDANDDGEASMEGEIARLGKFALLRVKVMPGAVCSFSYSNDGKKFASLGKPFTAREGKWIGAKIGLFCLSSRGARESGYADFDWFRFE